MEENLSWDAWADELNLVLSEMQALLWPDLIVLCGGITEEPDKFMHKLRCAAPLRVARCARQAGIVGAALATAVALPRAPRAWRGAAPHRVAATASRRSRRRAVCFARPGGAAC